MTPDDPRHGTYAGAQAHTRAKTPRCEPCREAYRRYHKRLEVDHARGIRRRVSPVAAGKHVDRLIEAGLSVDGIARLAGVTRATVFRASGRGGGYKQPPTMEASKLDALLAVEIPSTPGKSGYLPRLGVQRRIQALSVMAYSRDDMAEYLGGVCPQWFSSLVNGRAGVRASGPNVQASTWHRIDGMYRDLAMKMGPSPQARQKALAKGYVGPLGWDDIDDPDEVPDSGYVEHRPVHDPVTRTFRWPDEPADEVAVQRIMNGDWRMSCTRADKIAVVAKWRGSLAELGRLTGWKVERYVVRDEESAA